MVKSIVRTFMFFIVLIVNHGTLMAEVIRFTHTDMLTDFSSIGGGIGRTLSIEMDNGGAGFTSQTWDDTDFISATFASGGTYEATYSSSDLSSFVTDASGAIISSVATGYGNPASDNAGGTLTPTLEHPFQGVFNVSNSLNNQLFFSKDPWDTSSDNTGWVVSSAAVPEPSSFMLLFAGFAGAIVYRRRKRRPCRSAA